VTPQGLESDPLGIWQIPQVRPRGAMLPCLREWGAGASLDRDIVAWVPLGQTVLVSKTGADSFSIAMVALHS
jgi:hypothetical protein